MERRSLTIIMLAVAVLIFVAGWVGGSASVQTRPVVTKTVTVVVTPEPTVEPSPVATTVPAPVVRPVRPVPKPTHQDNDHHSSDHDDDDGDEGDSVKDEARKFNKNPDGYKPDHDCDAECQFEIKNYGDD